MRTFWRVVPWLLLGIPAGVLLVELFQSAPTLEDGPGTPYVVAEARLAGVQAASVVLLPGAHLLAVEGNADVTGDRSSCGNAKEGGVTYATLLRRRVDVSEVALLREDAGAVRVLLALAQAQQEALERAGFNTMAADWSSARGTARQRVTAEEMTGPLPAPPSPWELGLPEQDRPAYAASGPRVAKVRHWDQHDSGGGSGGDLVNLLAPQIVHHRIYVIPKSGASLFVRNALDQAARTVEIELSYVDRSVFGVEVPTGSYLQGRQPGHYSVREELESPP
jgi:hypothetical protein